MKKALPIIAGVLLGGVFLMASVTFFLKMVPEMKLPEGSPIDHFMKATGPTGFMAFVKVFELVGGILVLIPRTRALGLLALGPVIVNIVAFNALIGDPKGLLNPMMLVVIVTSLYLLWVERKKFAALLP